MPRHPAPQPATHISRIPRAHIDPIDNATDALALISLALSQPLRDETVVIVLDHQRRGNVITVVTGTEHVDLCTIVETFCAVATVEPPCGAAGLIVATVRPNGATRPGDVDRWLEASALADTFGMELIEWFVVGPSGPECPRDLIGELERW